MPRKKSVKKAAQAFKLEAENIHSFLARCKLNLSDEYRSWAYEYAIIRLYREFEHLILNALIGAINADTNTISETVKISFPKHLTDEVCEYLVIGNGYFDFRGRDGLIQTLKKFVPDSHWLVVTAKQNIYRNSLNRFCALRNYAAHESSISKTRAKQAINQNRISSAGARLKTNNRLDDMLNDLKSIAAEIERQAPY